MYPGGYYIKDIGFAGSGLKYTCRKDYLKEESQV
jgi:hypothetical protein